MNEVRKLLTELSEEGVQLWVHQDRLRVRPADSLKPERMAQLRRYREEIIAFLEQPEVSRTTPLAAGPRPDVLPLSYAQEGLWFLDQLGLLGPAYNFRSIVSIEGHLNFLALRQAFDELVERHEILRTRYGTVEGVGAQWVSAPEQARFEETDLSARPPEERRELVAEILQRHAEHSFDLQNECPFLVQLLRLESDQHLLIVNMHHIMIDGPSFAILFRDLAALYAALAGHGSSPLPELPAQYADYAVWQRKWLQGDILDRQLSYWRTRLADAPDSLDLPFDFVRPAVPDFRGGVVEFSLAPQTETALRHIARQHGSTLFMTLLAAFHLLLARWSGQRDICIGVPVDGRGHREAEDLVGFFLNTVVVRADLSHNPSFKQVLSQVRKRLLEAYEHRDLPFDRLVAELRPQRQLSRQPLFQVLFSYLAEDDLKLPGLKLTQIEPDDRTAKFDLSLFFSETAGGLQGGFEYATGLFQHATIERLARHFKTLLKGIAGDPGASVADLPLLTPPELRQIVVDWNRAELDFPQACIHELIEWQAERKPEATAVVMGEKSISYGSLNALANQVAHQLRSLGVEPDTLVGICLNRSLDLVAGILGILKAGGAYVPLDPTYPAARLAFMLADSRASVLVTESSLSPLLPSDDLDVLLLDSDRSSIESNPTANPDCGAKPGNLAYCIYTSGSTGNPKGIALQHSSAVACLTWAERTFGDELEGMLLSTSICFDLSIFELFSPLAAGASLILVRDALALTESWAGPWPTLINTVPSAAQALVDAGAIPRSVKVINLAGEPLQRRLVQQIIGLAPQARVYNLYGPSENTVYTTFCQVDGRSKVTIGRPVTNTKIYLLDEHMKPVPIGSPGQIYVAGAGLARGYWQQPGLTAQSFLPNPFGPAGARMYRSGDLGRYLPDGSIEFLGRIDYQVKIRGYRIELGEIESALLRCDGVSAAVVVAPDEPSGDRRLMAYVVAEKPSQNRLREALKETLPDYMLPAAYIFLDALPLMPNGKIDRKALPAPGSKRDTGTPYAPPRTPTEGLLAEIWSDVLKVPRVGIHDNFFDLGGHSLLATQVIARIRKSLHAEVRLSELFVAPSVAELARIVLDAQVVGDDTIGRADPALPLVASFAQQRMWFLDQFEPESELYNVAVAWRLRGPLDATALERSLQEIVRRHDVLRTVFTEVDGRPVPVVLDQGELPLDMVDLSVADDPEAEAQLRLQEDVSQPFDLVRGPMIRISFLRLDRREHILMIAFHHIVADGWSLDVILTELSILYGSFVEGNPPPLAELPFQYSDFARWQRDLLQGEVLQGHIEFWQRYLNGAPGSLDLPADRPRPPASTFRGGIVPFQFDEKLSQRLRELSQSRQVTLFMTMAAAFNVLLYRYSGQDDFCIGYSVGNRDRLETEGLIGIFANTLVLRTRIAPGDTFGDELARVRDSMLEADLHKDLPFEKLVEELQPQRDLSRHPIFQVTYSYSTTHGSRSGKATTLPSLGQKEVTLPGLEISLVEPENQTAKFDLALFVSDTGAGQALEGDFEYSSDLFEQETIERLAEHFEVLLGGIVAEPGAALARLPLLGQNERRQLLADWNHREGGLPAEKTLHKLFERQAQRTPQALAISTEGGELSYGQLNARANRLAHHLLSLGVSAEKLVGICTERSLDMVVAMLAVLKAGGAYVPLDSAYPPARLAQMIADSGADLLLTEDGLAQGLEGHGARLLVLDQDRAWEQSQPDANPQRPLHPSTLAYCIYTSGSTGRPKGVALTHANAVAFVSWARRAFSEKDLERVLFSTSICFDLSIFELFVPLASGSTVLLEKNALALTERHLSPPPTLLNTVPSAAQALLHEELSLQGLLTINLAGEPLREELVSQLRKAVPGVRIYNLYGPTEYTTYATLCRVDGAERISIGHPLDNTQVYVLDPYLQPVPIGVTGEIWLAGAGLARGYWNRPSQTGERFLPNPFGPPGSRMYRTGDLGRRRGDGSLEFLGRSDHQVKIRGYRIELGEIESALRRCPGTTESVAALREDVPGQPRLVAYVTGEEATIMREARGFLRSLLPEFMIPAAIVFLQEMPLTPNGKIDRKALPAPDGSKRETEYLPPRTPTECALAQIFSEVLQVGRVGLDDHFFELGGHSLLATRAVARIRHKLQCDLLLRELFSAPTVSRLAAAVEAAQKVRLEPIPRTDRRRPPPASFAQQRMWFLNQLDPESGLYNMPGAWRLKGPLDVDALTKSLNEIVRRHESLRTAFQAPEGVPLQIIAEEMNIALPLIEVAANGDAEAQIHRIVQQEGREPFQLDKGPLVRARLIKIAQDENVLLLTFHHLIADGWSMDILARELSLLYQAFSAGQDSPLPELGLQYADYAAWQRERLEGGSLREQLNYWTHYLRDVPETLHLPSDRRRPPVASHQGSWIGFELDAEVSDRLRRLSRQKDVTLFMTLASAFGILLHRLSGQDDLCIGYPVANRDRTQLEELVGLFVNMLVLRLRFSPALTFEDLLEQVRTSVLGANAHQDLPFEKLVEELSPQRDPAAHPIFQVTISLLEHKDPDLSGLDMTRLQPYDRTSKFDLSLFIVETEGVISGGFEYSTALYSRETLRRLIGHFSVLIEGLVEDPSGVVDALPLLTPHQRSRLLTRWNDTAADTLAADAVHLLVQEQAAENPDAPAVTGENECLSYQELNRRANRLARHLRSLGIGAESLVAVCLPRSPEMVVGLLGILKAGGAYVPLDPQLPPARLALMLDESQASLVLVQEATKDLVAPGSVEVCCLDSQRAALDQQSPADLIGCSKPLNLAYCIFTSGSTGKPKAVGVTHQGLLNLVSWHREYYGLGPDDRTTQLAGFSFDACAWEVWACLTAGSSLHLADEEIRRSPAKIPSWLAKREITHCFLPTPLAEGVLAEQWPQAPPLQALLTGGDILHRRGRLDDAFALVNHYGPTECSVVTTFGVVEPGGDSTRPPAIGRPIANTQVYLLDLRGEPVPQGVIGELHIGGQGVARGYLNSPQLTAERFLPNPFSAEPGARLYRTGDLGRYLPDGEIELSGRVDHQVKIRGYRVELGEIETILASHPDVRECAVAVLEEPLSGKRIVAYVVTETDSESNSEEWRAHLREMLPHPLVPSAFLTLDSLPLLPSGKVDRALLPAPERGVRGQGQDHVAPRTSVEKAIAAVWLEILPLNRVGIHDDFFACGGQSLLAAEAVSRIRDALGVEVSLRTFFEAASVAGLAQAVENLLWLRQGPPAAEAQDGVSGAI